MAVLCANCKGYHDDRHGVRACFAGKASPAPAPAAKVRKFAPVETFGQSLRRHDEAKAAAKATPKRKRAKSNIVKGQTCDKCESTLIYEVAYMGEKHYRCLDHPVERVLTVEQVAVKFGAQVEREQAAARKRLVTPGQRVKPGITTEPFVPAAMKAKATVRKFREGAEPLKYEGMEHSDDVKRCGRCAGTGRFITGMMNGVPTGPGGPCFRCSGKGSQSCCSTEAHAARYERIMSTPDAPLNACCDVVRNDLYDRFGIRISAF